MEIPERVKAEIDQVAPLMPDCDDWLTVKKILLLQLPSKLRGLFSTRDPKTGKQVPNAFEYALMDYYYEVASVRLVVKQ